MKLLKTVLLATDFTATSKDVVRTAIQVARTFHAELVLLHVVPEIRGAPYVLEMLRDRAADRMSDLRQELEDHGLTVADAAIVSGVPFNEIIRQADAHQANVIILGAGETKDDGQPELGVTAEKVLRKANTPVWVVTPGAADVKQILCPVDCSESSLRALDNAVRLAREFEAKLTVMTVIEPLSSLLPQWSSVPDEAHTDHLKAQRDAFDDVLAEFNFAGVEWQAEVRMGKPYEEILAVATELPADLLVMGTVGRTGLARILMGSVTERVVRAMRCSVLTVKSEHIIRLRLEAEAADMETHFHQGRALLGKEFPDQAIRQFELCLIKSPTYVPAWHHLAEAHDTLGHEKEAGRCRERAAELLQDEWALRVQVELLGRHPVFGNKPRR